MLERGCRWFIIHCVQKTQKRLFPPERTLFQVSEKRRYYGDILHWEIWNYIPISVRNCSRQQGQWNILSTRPCPWTRASRVKTSRIRLVQIRKTRIWITHVWKTSHNQIKIKGILIHQVQKNQILSYQASTPRRYQLDWARLDTGWETYENSP